jgi:hypothetical protein
VLGQTGIRKKGPEVQDSESNCPTIFSNITYKNPITTTRFFRSIHQVDITSVSSALSPWFLRERYSWGNYVNPNVKMDARMEQSVYNGRVLDLETLHILLSQSPQPRPQGALF